MDDHKHRVSIVSWNHVTGSFQSPTPPHFQTPALSLKHEFRHVRESQENYMRQNIARQFTFAGKLKNRNEAMTIREESRLAKILGEAVRYTHQGSPDITMPETTSWPDYLENKDFTDLCSEQLKLYQPEMDEIAVNTERLNGQLRSPIMEDNGYREYLEEQLLDLGPVSTKL
jgi:hypothetical protein